MSPAFIDKTSRVPYYYQLRHILADDMVSGRYAVGERLPSESQLCEDYYVSRTVVRQALMELTNDGLITRQKGRGSFVAAPKAHEHLAQSLIGLAEEAKTRGQTLTNRILAFDKEPATSAVATDLELKPGELVVHLERLRLINGEPHVMTSTYLPYDLCAGLLQFDMRDRSLYATLELDLGLRLHHGKRTIEALAMNARIAGFLDATERDPVLVLRSVAFLEDGRPIERFIAWHRGDRTRFDVHVVRSHESERQTV